MVDIHSHILPGVDDGARTVDESLEMLRMAAACGTTDIVATPHANAEYPYDAQRIREVYDNVRKQANGIINIHLACDFHLSYENLLSALSAPNEYTVNNHQYLLVELPNFVSTSFVENALTQLLNARFVPIITHPERNISLQSGDRQIETWVRQGALVQITAQSLTGRFGDAAKRFADKLLKSNLVHFVASDAHDCIHRPPDLRPAYEYVRHARGQSEADALFRRNPETVLYGDLLPTAHNVRKSIFSFRKKS